MARRVVGASVVAGRSDDGKGGRGRRWWLRIVAGTSAAAGHLLADDAAAREHRGHCLDDAAGGDAGGAVGGARVVDAAGAVGLAQLAIVGIVARFGRQPRHLLDVPLRVREAQLLVGGRAACERSAALQQLDLLQVLDRELGAVAPLDMGPL